MNKRVAILIVNWNGERYLKELFDSIQEQSNQDFDTYLIDNASTDSSIDIANSYKNINVLLQDKNNVYTQAYNNAAKTLIDNNKRYEYFLILNNDTILPKSFIEKIIYTFSLNSNIAIVVPAVVNRDLVIDSVGGKYILPSGTTIGFKNKTKYTKSENVVECFWASGCALTIKSDVFYNTGLYKDYVLYYDDVELSWRVRNLGYSVVATESTYVIHLGGGTGVPSNNVLYFTERNRIWCHYSNIPSFIFYITLPIFLLSRIALIPLKARSISNVVHIFKGIYDAYIGLNSQTKNMVSIKSFIQCLRLSMWPKILHRS